MHSHYSADENDNGDLDNNKPEEISCRICQATRSEEPTKRLIKPCKCSGSQSFVHVDCLNTWRNTSTTAYFACSVCKYQYQFQRTLVAQLVTREEVVVLVAVCMILAIIATSGLVVILLVEALRIPIDIAGFIYQFTETDYLWQRCHYYELKPVVEVVRTVYNNSNGVVDTIKSFIRLLRSPLPMMYFMCHPVTTTAIDVFVTGAAVVGSTGFGTYFYGHITRLRLFGGAHWLQYAVGTAMWFSSLGNRALGRIWLVVGCGIATREIYSSLIIQARRLSNWLGDKILEPN
eukprot:gene21318-27348_t